MTEPAALSSGPAFGSAAYEKLLGEIVSLRLPPGERLSVDALAQTLEFQPSAIESALVRLKAEGFVEEGHSAGYRVSSIHSADRFRAIYEFRLLLEPAAAGRAAQYANSEQKEACARLNADLSRLVAEDPVANHRKIAHIDREFHDTLARSCRNDLIAEALSRLHTHMHLFRLRYNAGIVIAIVKEHQLIVEGILEQDSAKAEAAMVNHIETSRRLMRPYYENLEGTD